MSIIGQTIHNVLWIVETRPAGSKRWAVQYTTVKSEYAQSWMRAMRRGLGPDDGIRARRLVAEYCTAPGFAGEQATMKQKRLFAEPPASPPADTMPNEIDNDQDWDGDCFTLEDDPDPMPHTDHTVHDVQLAIRDKYHLSFKTDRLICGIPIRLCPNGPLFDIHLVNVFERGADRWEPVEDHCVIQGPLSGGNR